MEILFDNTANVTVITASKEALASKEAMASSTSRDIGVATTIEAVGGDGSTGIAASEADAVEAVTDEAATDTTAIDETGTDTAVSDEMLTDTGMVDEIPADAGMIDEAVGKDIMIDDPYIDPGYGGDMGEGMYTETGMPAVKNPILSNWFFVIGVSVAVLAVSVVLGILLAKRKIKKGIELYED